MSSKKVFLDKSEEEEVIAAIKQAETNTSGEIRIHIEEHSHKPPLERAQEVFHLLNMDATVARNGVLFYVGVNDRTFAVIGDEGIDKVVEDDFWDCTKDVVLNRFASGQYKQGLIEGVLRAGERLKQYFPYAANDKNELPDTISRG